MEGSKFCIKCGNAVDNLIEPKESASLNNGPEISKPSATKPKKSKLPIILLVAVAVVVIALLGYANRGVSPEVLESIKTMAADEIRDMVSDEISDHMNEIMPVGFSWSVGQHTKDVEFITTDNRHYTVTEYVPVEIDRGDTSTTVTAEMTITGWGKRYKIENTNVAYDDIWLRNSSGDYETFSPDTNLSEYFGYVVSGSSAVASNQDSSGGSNSGATSSNQNSTSANSSAESAGTNSDANAESDSCLREIIDILESSYWVSTRYEGEILNTGGSEYGLNVQDVADGECCFNGYIDDYADAGRDDDGNLYVTFETDCDENGLSSIITLTYDESDDVLYMFWDGYYYSPFERGP
jgi:hypothetical protein